MKSNKKEIKIKTKWALRTQTLAICKQITKIAQPHPYNTQTQEHTHSNTQTNKPKNKRKNKKQINMYLMHYNDNAVN